MLLVCVSVHRYIPMYMGYLSMVCVMLYRYYVLHKLTQLTFLDSKPVSNEERKEAKRVGAFMRVVRPSSDDVSLSPSRTLLYLSHLLVQGDQSVEQFR